MNGNTSARRLVALLLAFLPGCATLRNAHEGIAIREIAHKAYHAERHAPGPSKVARHFERGWKQGFYNVSVGADPCPPSTPPQEYWSVKYQNPDGCRMISAWFEGYQRGVRVALAQHRDAYNNVPVGSRCFRQSSMECTPVEYHGSEHYGPDLPLDTLAPNETSPVSYEEPHAE